MIVRRILVALLVVVTGCADADRVIADDAAQRLLPLTAAAARCIGASHGHTDAPAAACTCRAMGGELAGKPLECHEGPNVLAFKGEGLPVLDRRDDPHWYALAYAPADRLSTRTEDVEVIFWGYGVLSDARGLPAHWHVLKVCKTCD